jgi:CBS domain-containing protein
VRLLDVITPDRVVVPLSAPTLQDAAQALLARLVADGTVSDVAKLAQRVAEEQSEDIVTLGGRAFILHYRTDAVRDLAVAIGTTPHGVSRRLGDDEQRAVVVVLVVAPPRMAARYLQVVSAFARLLAQPEIAATFAAQPTPSALLALDVLREQALPEQLTVRDMMTELPMTVPPDTPLRDAAREMVRSGVGGLPVVDAAGRVIGILGERELLPHLLRNYLSAGVVHRPTPNGPAGRRSTVRDVMTRQVLCVSPEQPLAEVANLMANKDVDRVPVVREGRLIGVLTRGDIVRKLIGS